MKYRTSKKVDKGLKICRKPQLIWAAGSFEQKRILQDLMFPEGIYLNQEKRVVRTARVNEIISRIARQSSDTAGNKKGQTEFDIDVLSSRAKGK